MRTVSLLLSIAAAAAAADAMPLLLLLLLSHPGILIEDQVWPKSCGHVKGKRVTSRDEAVSRIRAAADARCVDRLLQPALIALNVLGWAHVRVCMGQVGEKLCKGVSLIGG
jgi:hypothetical protein